MRVSLLQPGLHRGFAAQPDRDTIVDDLGLESIFDAMSGGDKVVREVAQVVLPATVSDPSVIAHRQAVLSDCLENRTAVRRLFEIASDAAEVKTWGTGGQPRSALRLSLEPLQELISHLRRLRTHCDGYRSDFRSEGFTTLFSDVADQLDDDYLDTIESFLPELQFFDGVLVSAGLGTGNKATDFALHQLPAKQGRRRFGLERQNGLAVALPEHTEESIRTVNELAGRGLKAAADAVSRSASHVHVFFRSLRAELAFYIGCLNLAERLSVSVPICFPTVVESGTSLSCRALRDVSLALQVGADVVGNDVDADGKSLIVVTGANNGGKSTFLRSVGVAQLMMQAGMFLVARSFRADIRDGIFTHFGREEDSSMTHGRLDEELSRLRDITDRLRPGSMLLFNEPFASTNEREASEIARPIIAALTEAGVKVVFVTHLADFARSRYDSDLPGDLFLRADRTAEGARTFRLTESAPLPTSYGSDTFRRVFGD